MKLKRWSKTYTKMPLLARQWRLLPKYAEYPTSSPDRSICNKSIKLVVTPPVCLRGSTTELCAIVRNIATYREHPLQLESEISESIYVFIPSYNNSYSESNERPPVRCSSAPHCQRKVKHVQHKIRLSHTVYIHNWCNAMHRFIPIVLKIPCECFSRFIAEKTSEILE